jgi:sortase B
MILAGRLAKIGNRILAVTAALLVIVMLLYGGYSLWDTWRLYRSAYISSDLLKYKPEPDGNGDGPTLSDLAAINGDVAGWITIDGTHIDYPLVQGKEPLEYINRDVYGNFSLAGAIFLDPRNSRTFTDSYSLLYGHHMDNGAMFGDVVEFEEAEYFNRHTTGTLYLTDGTQYRITLFACLKTDSGDGTVFNPTAAPGDNSLLLSYIREKSVQERDIGISGADRVIGLSTCEDAQTNGRTILYGRLEKKQ